MFNTSNTLVLRLLITVVLLFTVSSTSIDANGVMFTEPITGMDTPVDYIAVRDLKLIFTLSVPRWSNGSRVIVVLYQPDNPIQKAFLKEYFGMNSFRFDEIINSKINTGRISPPIIVETERDMIRIIETKPGSIGFVKSNIVFGGVHGIKRINVQ